MWLGWEDGGKGMKGVMDMLMAVVYKLSGETLWRLLAELSF